MRRSLFPIILVAALLGLLCLLAALQYRWLGQISDGERARLQKLAQTDADRFAEDFNREIQAAYFNFQMSAADWRARNWDEFNRRFDYWQSKTAYPNLIGDFYYADLENERKFYRYDRARKIFAPTELTDENAKLFSEPNASPINAENLSLVTRIFDNDGKIDRIMIRTAQNGDIPPVPLDAPPRIGTLVVKLDENVVKNSLLPDLARKYFSDSDSANYRIAVTNEANQTEFQTGDVTTADATTKIFDLSPDDFIFYANRDLLPRVAGEHKNLVYSRVETRTNDRFDANADHAPVSIRRENTNGNVEIKVITGGKVADKTQKLRIFESAKQGNATEPQGAWTLSVQHTDGSLEQFITNTRRKNLAVSFGILALLAVSVVLIFVSAQRAQTFARRQLDFVSSVSHEFRTPLAVIYSAGENLADGVTREDAQIARYGNLIKGEGKKLSTMVEQILEFAGARSGRRRYDLRETNATDVIENALAECRSLLNEKGFTVERDIQPQLPKISADAAALASALQNLIGNAVKYSDGAKYLKISARNGENSVKISVADKGIGITDAERKHIFEPFYRAKAIVDAQIHGNGLGLSLVQQIIEAHGGKVAVESEVGAGSVFTIEIPKIKNSEKLIVKSEK